MNLQRSMLSDSADLIVKTVLPQLRSKHPPPTG
jgi:hypothetical protein